MTADIGLSWPQTLTCQKKKEYRKANWLSSTQCLQDAMEARLVRG